MRPAVLLFLLPFCQAGPPDAGSFPGTRAGPDPVPALERAAARYARGGYFFASSDVYRRLAALRPLSPSRCAWQSAVVDNTLATGTKREVVHEIRLLAAIDRTLAVASVAPPAERQACRRALHDRLADLVFIWNKELTRGCTAYSWDKWPLLEQLFHQFLADFPDDPKAPEARAQLARLYELEHR